MVESKKGRDVTTELSFMREFSLMNILTKASALVHSDEVEPPITFFRALFGPG